MADKLKITLVKSTIGAIPKHKATVDSAIISPTEDPFLNYLVILRYHATNLIFS